MLNVLLSMVLSTLLLWEPLLKTEWKDPELHYRTSTAYDRSTGIQRTTLDPQGYGLDLWFEVPVFDELGKGYEKINAFFQELTQQFFSPDSVWITDPWEYATDPDGFRPTKEYPFFLRRRAWINSHTDKLVSVSIGYEWMMGGVLDTGSDSYTFRTDTGELVRLTDLVDESEEELLEIIFAVLEARQIENEYEMFALELDYLQDYTLDDYEFAVYEDSIVINFDKYEAAYGAYGDFDIKLPVQLNPKF